ncbi:hypothetical protein MHSWG343_00570 [Candidatus Mycoplasma haematohominis]|uniref:Uncharacterized protein n=1 Tax=Candidatus Mycoplasma haematohominis TaxID=1494318 RepID=A0A478FRM9_9MOLU|nr:hypothetical protein MHSWG343_00570 [Candidatus Mycoplasma haemohominis]
MASPAAIGAGVVGGAAAAGAGGTALSAGAPAQAA